MQFGANYRVNVDIAQQITSVPAYGLHVTKWHSSFQEVIKMWWDSYRIITKLSQNNWKPNCKLKFNRERSSVTQTNDWILEEKQQVHRLKNPPCRTAEGYFSAEMWPTRGIITSLHYKKSSSRVFKLQRCLIVASVSALHKKQGPQYALRQLLFAALWIIALPFWLCFGSYNTYLSFG